MQNLQQAIAVQQSYTSNLCKHINSILTQLTSLEEYIQRLNQRINMEQGTVQLNTLEFGLEIDRPAASRLHCNNTAVVSV